MKKIRLLIVLFLLAPMGLFASTSDTRRFEFEYRVLVPAEAAANGAVEIFLPLAPDTDNQRVLNESIDAPVPGSKSRESVYGNRYWHATLAAEQLPTEIVIRTRVQRFSGAAGEGVTSSADYPLAESSLFLQANERVVVDHPILEPIIEELDAQPDDSPGQVARSIYDWVVDNVEYKKVGSGWGNGDTFWACNERYGNCTDFHALFISLARSYGIPARFEMGFPVPMGKSAGKIGGYHCWVQYYLPEGGWLPIDASEAVKAPEKRDFFFGSHPLDRIQFSIGRDLRLGESHRGEALNYFVYPHAEVNGEAVSTQLSTSFHYRDLTATELSLDLQ